jgi:hypothetical protein
MLPKAVLCAGHNGATKLVEVPFSWQHGDPLPPGALEYSYPTAAEALATLANRGRSQSGLDVPVPAPRKSSPDTAEKTDRERYLESVERATQWRDIPPST